MRVNLLLCRYDFHLLWLYAVKRQNCQSTVTAGESFIFLYKQIYFSIFFQQLRKLHFCQGLGAWALTLTFMFCIQTVPGCCVWIKYTNNGLFPGTVSKYSVVSVLLQTVLWYFTTEWRLKDKWCQFFKPLSLWLYAIEGIPAIFQKTHFHLSSKGMAFCRSRSALVIYSCCLRSALTLCRRTSVFSHTFAGWREAIKHSSAHKQTCFQHQRWNWKESLHLLHCSLAAAWIFKVQERCVLT